MHFARVRAHEKMRGKKCKENENATKYPTFQTTLFKKPLFLRVDMHAAI